MKKKKKKKFKQLTSSQEKFLIKRLEQEWADWERGAKRHELVKQAKQLGAKAGKILLGTLLVSGVITVTLVAPNVFVAFASRGRNRRYIKNKHFTSELNKGSSRSYWRYRKMSDGSYKVFLTPRGKKVALRLALKSFKLQRNKKWDGLYRIVMFDISRRHNSARDGFRRKLVEIGMHPIQNSIFVYPDPCEEEVMFWASLFNVSRDVHVVEGKFRTNLDSYLRKIFSL